MSDDRIAALERVCKDLLPRESDSDGQEPGHNSNSAMMRINNATYEAKKALPELLAEIRRLRDK